MYFVFILISTWKFSKCLWTLVIQSQEDQLLEDLLQQCLHFFVLGQQSLQHRVSRRINKSSSQIFIQKEGLRALHKFQCWSYKFYSWLWHLCSLCVKCCSCDSNTGLLEQHKGEGMWRRLLVTLIILHQTLPKLSIFTSH